MFSARAIRERVRRQPFRPFRIVTSAGSTYEVRHPELVMVGRRELSIGQTKRDEEEPYYEDVGRVAIMHIVAIEDLAPRNGKRKRPREES